MGNSTCTVYRTLGIGGVATQASSPAWTHAANANINANGTCPAGNRHTPHLKSRPRLSKSEALARHIANAKRSVEKNGSVPKPSNKSAVSEPLLTKAARQFESVATTAWNAISSAANSQAGHLATSAWETLGSAASKIIPSFPAASAADPESTVLALTEYATKAGFNFHVSQKFAPWMDVPAYEDSYPANSTDLNSLPIFIERYLPNNGTINVLTKFSRPGDIVVTTERDFVANNPDLVEKGVRCIPITGYCDVEELMQQGLANETPNERTFLVLSTKEQHAIEQEIRRCEQDSPFPYVGIIANRTLGDGCQQPRDVFLQDLKSDRDCTSNSTPSDNTRFLSPIIPVLASIAAWLIAKQK